MLLKLWRLSNIYMKMPMIIEIDLDGVLFINEYNNWRDAKPKIESINFVNWLYDQGHTIRIATSRYISSPDDWYEDTCKQLKQYGVKYTTLRKKNYYDIKVDDKCINSVDTLKVLFYKFTDKPWDQLG